MTEQYMQDRAKDIINSVYWDLFNEYEGVPYTTHILVELGKRYSTLSKDDRLCLSYYIGGDINYHGL